MKSGTTVRFDCQDCGIEFEVTLEPKDKGHALDDKDVDYCPFCGSMSGLTSDEDDEDDDGGDE